MPTSFLFLREAALSSRAEAAASDAAGCSAAHAGTELATANAVKIAAAAMAAFTQRRNLLLFAKIILTSFFGSERKLSPRSCAGSERERHDPALVIDARGEGTTSYGERARDGESW